MKRLLGLALTLVLALSGCAPAASSPTEAPGETPSPAPAFSTQAPASSKPSVYTDWSQLGPHEKPEQPVAKFTRRYEEFTDTLIPADDYGFLIPFPGVIIARLDDDPYWGWGGDDYLYGLMTLDGEVVVDPVFSSAYVLRYWDEVKQESRELDCLVLQKVVKDAHGEPMTVYAFCARDGSWCTGFDYTFDHELLMERSEENILPVRRVEDASQSSLSGSLVYLDARTGEELGTTIPDSEAFSEGLIETASGWGYIDHSGRTVYTFPKGAEQISSKGNYISYTLDGQEYFLDKDWNSFPASLPEDFTHAMAEGDWFYQNIPDPASPEEGSCAFWNPGTGTRLDFPGVQQITYTITDDYTLLATRADLTRDEQGYLVCYDRYYTLLHLPTGMTAYLGRWSAVHFQRDGVTGELYLYLMGPDSHKDYYEYRALDGETLYRTDNPGFWAAGLFDRRAFDAKKNVVTLTDLKTGELLFSWPLHPAAD